MRVKIISALVLSLFISFGCNSDQAGKPNGDPPKMESGGYSSETQQNNFFEYPIAYFPLGPG